MKGTKIKYETPHVYRQELFRVSDFDLTQLKNIYGVSENTIKDSIQLLKDWFDKQPHFPRAELTDNTLSRFLACNKFSVEKTKTKIENLFTARTVVNDFFSVRDTLDPKMMKFTKLLQWVIFPQLTVDKCRVILVRLSNTNVEDFDAYLMYTLAFMVADIRCAMDAVKGDIYIWDFVHSSLGHVSKVPPTLIKKSFFVIHNCYGQSIKGIHMLNVPPFAEFIFNLVKGLQPKNIAERMYIHKNVESIYEFIPRSLFPKDMGGDEHKTSNEMAETFREAFHSPEWRKWFLETTNLKTDESKRLTKNNDIIDETYGLSGSFRKLDLD